MCRVYHNQSCYASWTINFPPAILCAAAPDQAPFMADESVLAVPELGKLEYNLKHYLAYAKKVQTKARQLNKLGKRFETNQPLFYYFFY